MIRIMTNEPFNKINFFQPMGIDPDSLFKNKLDALSYVQVFGDKIVVEIELPRFKRDEINIALKDGYLNIDAARKDGPKGRVVVEKIWVGNDVDENKASARLIDGVLYVELPTTEQLKGKQISITD